MGQEKDKRSYSLSNERIIEYAGWAKSSGLPASQEVYYASDSRGDVESALKALGFREGALTDKFHFRTKTSYSAGTFGAMSSGPTVSILPETKKLLETMLGVDDIAKPEHQEVGAANVAKNELAEQAKSADDRAVG